MPEYALNNTIMFYHKPVFAELFGLVILDVAELVAFKDANKLNEDLLQAFTTLDLGEQVSKNGIVIPMTGIAGEYYYLSVCNAELERTYLRDDQIVVKSGGWVIYTPKGEVVVCGIGYLKQFDATFFATTDKFARLPMPVGWSEVAIVGGIDDEERLVYELRVTPKSTKPVFSGNFEDDFSIIPA